MGWRTKNLRGINFTDQVAEGYFESSLPCYAIDLVLWRKPCYLIHLHPKILFFLASTLNRHGTMEQSINKHIQQIDILCICTDIRLSTQVWTNLKQMNAFRFWSFWSSVRCHLLCIPSYWRYQGAPIWQKKRGTMEWAVGPCYNSASAMATPMLFSQTHAAIYRCFNIDTTTIMIV